MAVVSWLALEITEQKWEETLALSLFGQGEAEYARIKQPWKKIV